MILQHFGKGWWVTNERKNEKIRLIVYSDNYYGIYFTYGRIYAI